MIRFNITCQKNVSNDGRADQENISPSDTRSKLFPSVSICRSLFPVFDGTRNLPYTLQELSSSSLVSNTQTPVDIPFHCFS